jgi:uncharacterized membrane protein
VAGSETLVGFAAAIGGAISGGGLAALRRSGAARDRIVVDGALEMVGTQRDFIRELTERVDHLVDEAAALRTDLATLTQKLDEVARERDTWRARALAAESRPT